MSSSPTRNAHPVTDPEVDSGVGTGAGACDCGGGGECCAGSSCALAELGQGECAVVMAGALAESDGALLRAMGLRAEARVRVCRRGSPCIVEIDGVGGAGRRVGLAKSIALRVVVRREGAAREGAPL